MVRIRIWVLPVITYGMEISTLTLKAANKLRTTPSRMKRIKWETEMQKSKDMMKRIATLKLTWVGPSEGFLCLRLG